MAGRTTEHDMSVTTRIKEQKTTHKNSIDPERRLSSKQWKCLYEPLPIFFFKKNSQESSDTCVLLRKHNGQEPKFCPAAKFSEGTPTV